MTRPSRDKVAELLKRARAVRCNWSCQDHDHQMLDALLDEMAALVETGNNLQTKVFDFIQNCEEQSLLAMHAAAVEWDISVKGLKDEG